MIKHYLLISTLFFIFIGCTNKNIQVSGDNVNAIKYTKKRDIIENNEVKAMFFASYLNRVSKEYKNPKLNSFIVGIHYVNRDNHDLIENRFTLSLNDKKPLNLIKLDNNSELLKNISLKNKWASYYLVHFKNIKKEKVLNLKLLHPLLGEVEIEFQK